MDQIANQFDVAGAMENWGLITYGETGFLMAENYTSTSSIDTIIMVNAHEIAHQYTGNLVTCDWWDEIWLNEGMARYLQYYGVSFYDPSMRSIDRLYSHEQLYMLANDDHINTHPIIQPIEHADVASFDSIAYDKGASMMRHMEAIVGFNGLMNGLKYYLAENQYGTGTTQNFFDHVTSSAISDGIIDPNIDIADIMHNYFFLKNYPLITVTRDYFRNVATVTQTRFLREPDTSGDGTTYEWVIPLTWKTVGNGVNFSNPIAQVYFRPEEGFVEVGVGSSDLPVIFNIEAKVYARVNYDERNWDLITQYLATQDLSQIHPINRASLLNDALHLSKTGILGDYRIFNDLISNYLPRETDYIPLRVAQKLFGTLNGIVNSGTAPPNAINALSAMTNLFKTQYLAFRMTLDPDDSFTQLFWKHFIVDLVCNPIAFTDCRNDAVIEFNKWMNVSDPDVTNPINENVRKDVYCNGLRLGGQTELDFLRARYDVSLDPQERKYMSSAFGCSPVRDFLEKHLNTVLERKVPDAIGLFRNIYTNSEGQEIANRWLQTNQETLKSQFNKLYLEILQYLQEERH